MRPLALLLVGVASLAVGCGSAAVTNTAVVSPASTNAALPLSATEHDFVEEVQTARPTIDTDVRTLVGYGNAACTTLSSGGTEAAVNAVKAAGPVDDATARAVVSAAADHLCPGSSASSTTTPATTTAGVAAGAGAGAGAAVPRRIAAPPRTTTVVPTRTTPRPATTTTPRAGTQTSDAGGGVGVGGGDGGGSASYKNCAAVRAAGAAPIHRGEPGYSSKLDRDGDGVACDT